MKTPNALHHCKKDDHCHCCKNVVEAYRFLRQISPTINVYDRITVCYYIGAWNSIEIPHFTKSSIPNIVLVFLTMV